MENIHNAAKQGFVQSKLSSPPPPTPQECFGLHVLCPGEQGDFILWCGYFNSICNEVERVLNIQKET